MLDKHLIAKTEPVAVKENIVFYENYRVTVLTDNLFRIEQSESKEFCDWATSAVWYRNLPANKFTVDTGKNFVRIVTSKVELYLLTTFNKSYVVLGNKKIKLNNKDNLKGTMRTLDQCDGETNIQTGKEVVLGNGVVSRNGVAILDDSRSPILKDDGEFYTREVEQMDIYVFAYGKNYKKAVKALFDISGHTPMLPRYALGNWWSRYYAYSDKAYINLLDKFEENGVPLTVATVDMDWHYSKTLDKDFAITESGKNTDFYGGNDGWTGYSWNKELFPNPRGFLRKVKDKNLKVTLNVHPALGVRWFEDAYAEFAKKMEIDAESGEKIEFDMTNSEFVNNYFKLLHRPNEKDGVDFWWIDWQQGETTKKKGVDPLLLLNHYHYLDKADTTDTPLILSRYFGAGSHRYPIGFSGDTLITWKTLKYLPYFTATASNVGYGWWSHDIGGHFHGVKDDELYLRSVQYAVFSPILRLHSCDDEMMSKEPWNYRNGIGELAIKALKYRHSLIPFIYSLAYKCFAEGDCLVEPTYYYYDCEQAYEYKNQYFFGGLLVAPITDPTKKGYASTKVWLPKGKWTDIFTGDEYDGERELEVYRTLDEIPVFAKDGTIIVRSGDEGNSIENPQKLIVEVYNGTGQFTLYEEGDKGALFTHFRAFDDNGKQYVTINCDGKDVAPKKRTIELCFKNVKVGSANVYVNDKKHYAGVSDRDYLRINLANFKYGAEYIIEVDYANFSRLKFVKDRAFKILSTIEGENKVRNEVYENLKKCQTVEEFEKAVQTSAIDGLYKKIILNY